MVHRGTVPGASNLLDKPSKLLLGKKLLQLKLVVVKKIDNPCWDARKNEHGMILLGASFKIAGIAFKSSKKDLLIIPAKEMTKVDALYNSIFKW